MRFLSRCLDYAQSFEGYGAVALSSWRLDIKQCFSSLKGEAELDDFMNYLDSLKNFEKSGVPERAGTDSDDGFDLCRMQRLMDHLGNPQFKFKAVHIAGTKGKGSTAAFLSNILRTEGYSVGCYTSPHIVTIRERMSIGKLGESVSAKALNSHFHQIKQKLDEAIQLENGCLSHFEVLTGIAFSIFAQENVDIAIIEAGLGGARDATNILCSSGVAASVVTTIGEEHLMALGGSLESIAMAKAGIIKQGRPVVLGGPFLPHIEHILRDKASLMYAPVVSASDSGIRTCIKGLGMFDGRHRQLCDIVVRVESDFKLFIELFDMKMLMLGNHQLQNAATATCAALCLRNQEPLMPWRLCRVSIVDSFNKIFQIMNNNVGVNKDRQAFSLLVLLIMHLVFVDDTGWTISDGSIRLGLENTCLPGRSQFLTSHEAEVLGLCGATILLDGAHTKESARALMDTIRMACPKARLALVVAMAKDKDHWAFAREFLSVKQLEAVFLTEAEIAGSKSRTTTAPLLREYWVQASEKLGISTLYDGLEEHQESFNDSRRQEHGKIMVADNASLEVSMRAANEFLRGRGGTQSNLLVVTGSLHVVSSVLARLSG